jgi:hypothetical protein
LVAGRWSLAVRDLPALKSFAERQVLPATGDDFNEGWKRNYGDSN